jgi:adenosylmethionine-8-amino-7-oxononanoate aminotransferase
LACAAGIASLDIFQKEDVIAQFAAQNGCYCQTYGKDE